MAKTKQPAANEWDDEPATTAAAEQTAAEDTGPASDAPAPGTVRVRCITDRKPWTDTKALAEGEEADVPLAVAKALLKNKFVERV